MKVLHLDSGPDWRGGQQQLAYLASGLLRHAGVEQFFGLGPASRLRKEIEGLNLTCYPLSLRSEADPIALSRLILLLRRLQPDLIHAHDARSLGLAAILRAVGASQPIVAHRRVIFPIKNNSFSKWKYQQVPTCIIAVSWHIRHLLLNYGIAPERIKVVYDSAEVPEVLPEAIRDRARERLGLDRKSLILGCVGHFTTEKGHADLIKGFFRIQTQFPEARLLLIGDGPLKDQYRQLIVQLNLSQKVILPGMIPDLRDSLAAMDLFVFPSVSEGLGSVLLKAMAHRVPVFASRVGGIPEIVIEGKTGFLFSPGDPVALADCVLLALRDLDHIRRCTENAAQRITTEFSITKMAQDTARIYSNVLKS
jgi:glycosyltransferase involved in cell wall biosynthesis